MPGLFRINLEKGLFLAFAVLLTLFMLLHGSLRPDSLPPLRQTGDMPVPPEIVPWQLSDFLIIGKSQIQDSASGDFRDPFHVVLTFPPEAPKETPKNVAEPEPEPTPLPKPAPRTVTIRTSGFFTSLSGKTYIMLEVVDSRTGTASRTCIQGEEIFPGHSIREVNRDFTIIATPDNSEIKIPWNGEHTFLCPDDNR